MLSEWRSLFDYKMLTRATQVCFPDCHNVLSGLLGIGNTPVFYMDFTSRVHPMHLTYIQGSCGFSSSHKNLVPNLFTLNVYLVGSSLFEDRNKLLTVEASGQ
jgi:hypothetical protein